MVLLDQARNAHAFVLRELGRHGVVEPGIVERRAQRRVLRRLAGRGRRTAPGAALASVPRGLAVVRRVHAPEQRPQVPERQGELPTVGQERLENLPRLGVVEPRFLQGLHEGIGRGIWHARVIAEMRLPSLAEVGTASQEELAHLIQQVAVALVNVPERGRLLLSAERRPQGLDVAVEGAILQHQRELAEGNGTLLLGVHGAPCADSGPVADPQRLPQVGQQRLARLCQRRLVLLLRRCG
mmetsp:Transcript_63642/g.163822  ORF Transcript_63642/g.163822 Transcript_63642/m.163822 type:complete len:240 (-) Transcript_63642:2236-2955(-)